MNNAFRDKSKDHKSKHYWFRYLLGQGLNNHNLISLSPYPREISQATMMAGSSRWQSAVIGGNGAWRGRMRTMNPKSNRTCLYRRSDRGPVLECPITPEARFPISNNSRPQVTNSSATAFHRVACVCASLPYLVCYFQAISRAPSVPPRARWPWPALQVTTSTWSAPSRAPSWIPDVARTRTMWRPPATSNP